MKLVKKRSLEPGDSTSAAGGLLGRTIDRRAFLRELDEVLHELAMEMESRDTTPARSARQLKRFVIAITDLRAPQPWNQVRVPERAHGRGREGSTDEDVYRA